MESRTSTEQSSLHLVNEPDEIELVLKPHPAKETSLSSIRFLKTTANATSKREDFDFDIQKIKRSIGEFTCKGPL